MSDPGDPSPPKLPNLAGDDTDAVLDFIDQVLAEHHNPEEGADENQHNNLLLGPPSGLTTVMGGFDLVTTKRRRSGTPSPTKMDTARSPNHHRGVPSRRLNAAQRHACAPPAGCGGQMVPQQMPALSLPVPGPLPPLLPMMHPEVASQLANAYLNAANGSFGVPDANDPDGMFVNDCYIHGISSAIRRREQRAREAELAAVTDALIASTQAALARANQEIPSEEDGDDEADGEEPDYDEEPAE